MEESEASAATLWLFVIDDLDLPIPNNDEVGHRFSHFHLACKVSMWVPVQLFDNVGGVFVNMIPHSLQGLGYDSKKLQDLLDGALLHILGEVVEADVLLLQDQRHWLSRQALPDVKRLRQVKRPQRNRVMNDQHKPISSTIVDTHALLQKIFLEKI